MSDISFYHKLTNELIEDCGFSVGKYDFSYLYQGTRYSLNAKGKRVVKLDDYPADVWKVVDEGLTLTKEIKIESPHLLYGKDGVLCKNAELGICIIWTNSSLTQTGYILPMEIGGITQNEDGITYRFSHTFEPGEIDDDLTLEINAYVKRHAEVVLDGEESLINQEGVSLGIIESITLDFTNAYMDFPIEEYPSDEDPLWWLEVSEWEDPKVDLFKKENVCLYLNPKNPACPLAGDEIKNVDLLIEIISSAYFMLFQRLSPDDRNKTKSEKGYQPYSICSILHQFIIGCDYDLEWSTPELLRKSIQKNVAAKFREEET